MAQNFIACEREQELLLPPSLREWLPDDHLAWFVLDAVAAMDLQSFLAGYREDGWGRAAHDPAMMVALLVYAYAIGERSSRRIERRCHEDVAVRVITANQAPDHTTIARFRQRHERPLGELFGEVLELCADAALVHVELIAVDGTKVHANASQHANRDYEQIAREVLEEAERIDAEEDERFGDRRGDELPPELSTAQGRRGWLREAKRRLDERRAAEARPIPASRPARLQEAKRRLDEELWTECQANAAYEAYRARGRMKDGRRFGRPPDPYRPPATPAGVINVTDPDSRNVKTSRGWVQGYNAQAVVTSQQIVIAADVTVDSPDFGHLEPMITAAPAELANVGITTVPQVVLADAGYWPHVQMDAIVAAGMQVLIPPDAGKRKGTRPGWDGGLYAFMRRVLATDHGGGLYAKRQGMIEPVFADTKFNRRCDRFQRRGRSAARSEWRLIAATHNLLKLWRHTTAPMPASSRRARPAARRFRGSAHHHASGHEHRPRLSATASAQRWHELGPPPLSARWFAQGGNAGALEEAPMAIVAGFDVHRAQITFDAFDTESGEVSRGRIDATPAAVTRWTERFDGGEIHVAVEAARAGCSSATRSSLPARWRIWPSRWRRERCAGASGAPRPIARTPAGCASCSPTGGCRRRGSRPSTCASGVPGRGCGTR
jgi:transposase